jgi:putative nucleotidyltransferase with HDIG domain
MATVGANEKLAAELGKIVLARIASGRLTLPVMPEVANRCLAHLRDPKIQQRKITAEIEREPLLAASILRNALTASNAGAGVKTLDQAISCLGLQKLKSLLVEFMARELFRSGDSRIQSATKQVWDHSIAVAVLARDIAALTGGVDSDTCYLAGLLHDIGKPIIVAMLLEAERRLGGDKANWIDVRVWLRSVEQMHRQVGIALADEWKLPEDVVAVLRDCSEYDTANRGGPANIVRFANALAKREGFTAGPVDAADIDALIMVGRSMIGADDDVIARLVAGLPERVSQAA